MFIEYLFDVWCVEFKLFKLYLWGFREWEVFVEWLVVEIVDEIFVFVCLLEVMVIL